MSGVERYVLSFLESRVLSLYLLSLTLGIVDLPLLVKKTIELPLFDLKESALASDLMGKGA